MKKYILFPIALIISTVLFSQGVYNNGAKIVVGSGTFIYISGTSGNYRNETNVTNGSIDLTGTIKVEGNISNNVAGADIFTAVNPGSEVVLTGTTPQTLGGSTSAIFTFVNLTINNSSGIIVTKNTRVDGLMTFITGLIDIGNNNFMFGPSASVLGTPSASSMIIATGTGQVQKTWTGIGTFTYPVGDNSVTAEYSPVSLNFTSGTFAPGAFAGVNLVNTNYNDPAVTGSYLNRYWNISQTGITAFVSDALLQYTANDVVGTESSINGIRVVPTPLAYFGPANTSMHQLNITGISSFGTFTGALGVKTVNLTLFLEGLYSGSGLMRKAQGLGVDQFPGNTSDVITVEMHDPVNYATLINSVSNVNLSTSGQASFNLPSTFTGSYYLTIKHRNSIATVSAAPVSFVPAAISYDFSNLASQAFGNNVKNIGGLFIIYSGDVDQDGFIGVTDMTGVDNQSAMFGSGYLPEDLNGDGTVGVTDMLLIDNNSAGFIFTITP